MFKKQVCAVPHLSVPLQPFPHFILVRIILKLCRSLGNNNYYIIIAYLPPLNAAKQHWAANSLMLLDWDYSQKTPS